MEPTRHILGSSNLHDENDGPVVTVSRNRGPHLPYLGTTSLVVQTSFFATSVEVMACRISEQGSSPGLRGIKLNLTSRLSPVFLGDGPSVTIRHHQTLDTFPVREAYIVAVVRNFPYSHLYPAFFAVIAPSNSQNIFGKTEKDLVHYPATYGQHHQPL